MSMKNKKVWKQFAKQNAKIMADKKVSQVRSVVFQAYREILMGSPVDTGRFRSNWMVSAGQPSTKTVQGSPKKEGQPPSVDETQDAQVQIKELGNEDSIYISNNLPYAQKLENGHSQKNRGFVAAAEANLRNRLKAIEMLTLEN